MENEGILSKYSPAAQLAVFMLIAGVSVILFSMLSAVIVFPLFGLNALGGVGWMNSLEDENVLAAMKLMQFFNAIGLFVVPPIIFAYLTSRNKARYLYLDKVSSPGSFLIVIFLIIAALPAINWMAEVNNMLNLPEWLSGLEQWMKEKEQQAEIMTKAFLTMKGPTDLVVNLLIVAIIPAIGEELLFRGVVQKLFSKITGNIHWGVWIAAILFSSLHGQFYGFVPRMMLGAMLGYLLVWSGSMWLPIMAHFINNGLAVCVAYLINQEIIPKEVENVGMDEGQWIYVLFSVLIISGLLYSIWKTERKTEQV